MPYFFWSTARWYSGALCCRYLVVRFGKLYIPMLKDGSTAVSEWHWALGFFTDGRFEVLGAWQDDGGGTAQRIAVDLYQRGIERVKAVVADDHVVDALTGLRPKVCGRASAELAASSALGPRMRRVIRWADIAGLHLQGRMSRVAKLQAPFANQAAAAEFIARAFQRADRDLLHDRLDRACPAPYGASASAAALAAAN
ncbi:MAG TPA: hypothetical protein VGF12_14060 [Roseateles sp.]|uniref:transposase n=1 Tax=Roseateles sp. TaxID=1971397 RepID=UPI002ED86AD3